MSESARHRTCLCRLRIAQLPHDPPEKLKPQLRATMRRFLAFILLMGATALWAQQPPKLEPLPEPPSLPPGVASEAPGDSPVQITPGVNDQVEEIVIDGKRTIRVTTPTGLVYYLKDDSSGTPRGGIIDQPVRVPMWVIQTF